ncbi:tripartite motif-containing protein 26-like [Dendropsophus ebraccatus]|uniref:tripartite motif-containing protein 26-like n=1 Tax=Dendropsophus ebraccatus TaxID=150705 RepID=UPI003831CA13
MASAGPGEEFKCSICLSLYTDPVTLRCGHNFCRGCIDQVLNTQDGDGVYSCPECREEFLKSPALQRNLTLCNVVENFMSTHQDDDLISSTYSDDHLRAHSKSPEHVLTDPSTSLEKRKCSVHKKVLEYYCTEDNACICVSCRLDGEHQGHQVETLDEASEKKKKKLRNVLQKIITKRENTEERVRSVEERWKMNKKKANGEAERVTVLFICMRRRLDDLEKRVLREISRQEEQLSLSLSDVIQKLEIKKDELSRKMRHIEELCNMADPLTVLQDPDTGDLCKPEREGGNGDTGDPENKDNEEKDIGDLYDHGQVGGDEDTGAFCDPDEEGGVENTSPFCDAKEEMEEDHKDTDDLCDPGQEGGDEDTGDLCDPGREGGDEDTGNVYDPGEEGADEDTGDLCNPGQEGGDEDTGKEGDTGDLCDAEEEEDYEDTNALCDREEEKNNEDNDDSNDYEEEDGDEHTGNFSGLCDSEEIGGEEDTVDLCNLGQEGGDEEPRNLCNPHEEEGFESTGNICNAEEEKDSVHTSEFCNSEEEEGDEDNGDLCEEDGDKEAIVGYDEGDQDIEQLLDILQTMSDVIQDLSVTYVQDPLDILLDENTAGNYIIISDDLKTATWTGINQNRPVTAERFYYRQVMSSGGFSSGQHYWDVEIEIPMSPGPDVCSHQELYYIIVR